MKKTSRLMMVALLMANFAGSAALAIDTTDKLGCPAVGGTSGRKAVESAPIPADDARKPSTAVSGNDSVQSTKQ